MSSNNILLFSTIAAIILGVYYSRQSSPLKENFVNVARTVQVDRVVNTPRVGDFVSIPGQYQSILAPRQPGMVDYGAFIRYNRPSEDKLGTNMGSLASQTQIKENFRPAQEPENYTSVGDNVGAGVLSALPVSQSNQSPPIDAMGQMEDVQPIIYDRYMYANQKSRLHGGGDPIRGDLPILPIQAGWFSPSASPNIDLRSGALAVMGGVNNDTTHELLALKSAAAGGLLNTGSGINYSVQKSAFTSAAGGDVRVTAFP